MAPAKVAFVLLLVEEDHADQVHGQRVDAEGRDGEADGRQDEGQVDVLALVVEDAVVGALQGNDGAVHGEEQRRLHNVVAVPGKAEGGRNDRCPKALAMSAPIVFASGAPGPDRDVMTGYQRQPGCFR